MRCRCGNDINNVPEHLRGLASWVCQQCTNAAPKQAGGAFNSQDSLRRPMHFGRKKQAA
jgi:hypothetical protein